MAFGGCLVTGPPYSLVWVYSLGSCSQVGYPTFSIAILLGPILNHGSINCPIAIMFDLALILPPGSSLSLFFWGLQFEQLEFLLLPVVFSGCTLRF